MNAKDLLSSLGDLLDATGNMSDYNANGYENSIPDELQDPEPIFEFDHNDIISSSKSKALKYLKKMVDSIVPEKYQKNPVIQDKIEQDTEQLAQLFYQLQTNNTMMKAAMDVVSKGDTQPRMFEVYTKLMTSSSELSKQITELLNLFRKYYIDTYLDLRNKEDEEEVAKEMMIANKKNLAITNNIIYEEESGTRFTSTKDLVENLHENKKEKFRKKFLEAQNKEE